MCSSDLVADVWYAGTEEQWAQIDIASDNDPLTGARIHYRAGEYLTFVLPAETTTIESEAFAGLPGKYRIIMTDSVTSIDGSAFTGTDVIIMAPVGSYAETWAELYRIPFAGT